MKRAALFIVLLGHAAFAAAQAAPTLPKIEVPYTQFALPNGLRVILHEDHTVPMVPVNMWYHVGSARERPKRTGFAHLFEHLMFMGSGHVKPGEFDDWLGRAGGSDNGAAGDEKTTARPSTTGPTATSTCRRTPWSSRCFSSRTEWVTCAIRCRPTSST